MSTEERSHRAYRFGEFSLDLHREALYRGDSELHLRPKALQVLRMLLENSGRLVSKTELHDVVWTRSVVTDDSLAHCIADIRRALGDDGFEMIKTVPRRGYVFDQAVTYETALPPAPAAGDGRRFTYRPLAAALAIGAVTALLLSLGAGRGGGIPAAAAVAGENTAITVAASSPSTPDIDARNHYDKGRYFFKRRGDGDIERAEASFKAALEKDPDLADAWIGLAGVYSVRMGVGTLGRDEGLPLLGDATRHGIRLAPGSAEAHIRRARYFYLLGESLLARQHLEKALALDPNDVLVLTVAAGEFAHGNRIDEAIELQRRAIRNDPTSASLHHNLVWYLLAAGRYPEAAAAAGQYRALYPPGIDDEGELFADVEILQGNYEQALIQAGSVAKAPTRDRNLAMIHHALGQQSEADAALQRLLDAGDEQAAIHIAEVFAHRGNAGEAIRWLSNVLRSPEREASPRGRASQDTLWLLSPYLIGLRSDERWQALYDEVFEGRGYSKLLALAADADVAKQE